MSSIIAYTESFTPYVLSLKYVIIPHKNLDSFEVFLLEVSVCSFINSQSLFMLIIFTVTLLILDHIQESLELATRALSCLFLITFIKYLCIYFIFI